MLETINTFAGFNLAAIIFSLIIGGVVIIALHYLLMPVLNFVLITPLVSIVMTTWEFFSSLGQRKEDSSDVNSNNQEQEKKLSERFIDWFDRFFIIKVFFFLYIPFVLIIYYFEARSIKIDIYDFNDKLIFDTLMGSLIFVAVVFIVSLIAKLGQIAFKKSFPVTFLFLFFLGFLQYLK